MIIEENGQGGSVGERGSAAVLGGVAHVFYQGSTSALGDGVRDARWNGTTWVVKLLDGVSDGSPTAARTFAGGIRILLGDASYPGRSGDRDLLLARGP